MTRFEDLRSMRERSGNDTEYPRGLPGIPASGALPPSLNAPMARAGGGRTLGPQPGVPLVPKDWGGPPGSFDYSNPPPPPLPIKPYGERLGQLPEGYGFERRLAADVTLTPQSRIEEGFKGVDRAIREGVMDPQGQNASRLPEGYGFERPARSRPLDNSDIQVLNQMQHNQPGMPSKADREALMALIEQYGFANPPR